MTTTIAIAMIAAVFSGLLTYFIKSASEKSKVEQLESFIKESIVSSLKQHEQIYHRAEVAAIVKEEIKNHEDHCPAPEKIEVVFQELRVLRTAMVFLVSKNNGNPKELGLI